ncbi:carboxypeptidase regulatory-like domain-containing protein [Hungatella hathewayi]|uniref:carboxypeptidase regulatory-like domain-containing protein n=1 Tax=Hungatella hathewayi TaxID=154046 RepID=UPI0035650EBA
MKKSNGLRRGAAALLVIPMALSGVPLPAAAQMRTAEGAAGEITVDPQIHYQTLEGWGTSLCWWGNVIGSAGERDTNGNGRPDREEIAELAFSPDYLNLNIVRYNVGGGDKPDSSIKRVEGRVPGWSKDMFGTDDGSGVFLENDFYQKESAQMNDAGQIWMMEQANQWRLDSGDIINEVFSNSPPYYMTKSGSSTGGNDWNDWEKENLKDDCYDDFGQYLARAVKWLDRNLDEKFGTGINYVEPLNEPDTNYWLNGSTKQEGCIFYPGESQIKAYQEMKKALTAEGMTEVRMTGTDETSLGKAIRSFNKLDTQTRGDLEVISAHTYSGSDSERARLRDMAASYDKGLWMSEVTKGGGDVHNEWSHGNMGQCQTKSQSEGIMSDLKNLQSSAWIAWLVADSEYECIQTNQNWGLIHYVFEEDGPVKGYHTNLFNGDGSVKDSVPEAGYWAVTKQFYTMMQYSKYLKAGYTMIEIGDSNMCAAVSPDRRELVIVAQNFSGDTRNTSIDLSEFPNASNVKLYRTSDSENCQEIEASISGSVLNVSMPASYSVSTYVITGEEGPLYDETGYKKIVDSNVEATEDTRAAGAVDLNKFTYTGSWGEGWDWGTQEKYTTEKDAEAVLRFSGVQAAIYGKKSRNGAKILISVDGEEAVPVNAGAQSEARRSHLYTTPLLEDGEHTVTIRMAEEQTVSKPEIVLEYAEIVHGRIEEGSSEYTKEALAANDYVLYMANCGTPDPSVVPNTDSERMGLLQSNVDQAYGKDVKTGRAWGRDADTENSIAVNYDGDAADIGNSFIYMSDNAVFDRDKSCLGYSFEMPQEKLAGVDSDTYEVTVAFKHPWDWRTIDISLEGNVVDSGVGLDRYQWVSRTYKTEVTDGVLNVQVKNPQRTGSSQDPVLNFIKVRALEETYSISGTVKSDHGENVGDLEVKLYRGNDTGAEPVAAVRTDTAGAYVFKELEEGVYSVVLSAAGGYKEIVKRVTVETADVTEADFTMGGSSELYTKEELLANNYVLYTVNCGTPDPTVLPNSNTEKMGLLQSNVDQEYGKDPETGSTWGRNPDHEYSKALKQGEDAYDIGNSFIYMDEDAVFDKDKSRLGYSFELPENDLEGIESNTYEVTVAFKHWWDERWVNISLEGKTVATDIGIGYDEWVSKTFTTEVTDGVLNVEVGSPRRNSSKQDPILNFIKVRAVEEKEPEITEYDSFTGAAGAPMYDTNGKYIQAHGGQIQQLTVDGETKWYWVGEDKTNDYRPVGGIHVYSSDDLYNWDDEGVVLQTMESMAEFESDPYFRELYGDYTEEEREKIFVDLDRNNCVMERPKMIYNEKNDNYVIWFHADGRTPDSDADYGKAKAGVAVSDSPTGPFKLLGSYKLNYHNDPNADHGYDGWAGRGSVRDMNLFVDDDKTAYVIYSSEGNKTTFISRLNDDYTALEADRDEAVEGEHFTRNFVGWSREAPAMFKYNDKYYIINSGCTGWSPNRADYAVADHPMGPWTSMGDPCTDWGSDTTYDTQSTCVFPVDAENGKFIYMGDRWNAGYLRDSRYVWLPVEFQEGGRIALRRDENWKLEELAAIISEIPKQFVSLAELAEALPDKVDVMAGGEIKKDVAITWDPIDTGIPAVGDYTVYGTLEGVTRKVGYTVTILNGNTSYFFDCGTEDSDYFELLKSNADGLRNTQPDQAYQPDNHAGYLGAEDVNFGKHTGGGLYGNGWWAKEDEAIEYAFDLAPGEYSVFTGYQEWWNTDRDTRISAVRENADGREEILSSKTFTLGRSDRNLVQELKVTVPKTESSTCKVTVRVEKAGDADPVLSFISIVPEKTVETLHTISGAVTADGTSAEGFDVRLYAGTDKNLASPSNAVRTKADGTYTFPEIKDGTYIIEVPEQKGWEQDVMTVAVSGQDVTGVDFNLTKKPEEETEREIRITSMPVKRSYLIGEELETDGLEVTLFQEGVKERILEEWEYITGDLDSAAPGTKKVWITYEDEERKPLKTSFEVAVYEEEAAPEIKIVKKPNKLSYLFGEDLELTGIEVRGKNLSGTGVTILNEGDYEVGYEFLKSGKSVVTVSYILEDGAAAGIEVTDSFEVTVYGDEGEEVTTYVTGISMIEKPHQMIYGIDEDFDETGMVVEKTVAVVVASSSNASYRETVPLGDLQIEPEEFSKTGRKKVLITYQAEGKDGEEKEFTDTLSVTVAKSGAALTEGKLNSVWQKLEKDLSLGGYLTDEEKQEAFSQALEEVSEVLDVPEGSGRLSDKAFAVIGRIEKAVLDAYDNISTSVQADSRLKNVQVIGLGLSADLESEKNQELRIRFRKPTDSLPDEILNQVKNYVAIDIALLAEGEEIQPKLPIRVTMDIPEGLEKENLVLYHYHDGEIELIRPVIKGKRMSFDVWELSMFVAANTKEKPKPVNPDRDNGSDTDTQGPGYTVPGEWKKNDTGWWYEKKEGGYISASWARINGLWYCFDESGYMKTGWILDQGSWYYLNDDGSMAAQKWILWNEKWYYLMWNGAMAVNTMTPDGYVVGYDGVWNMPGGNSGSK